MSKAYDITLKQEVLNEMGASVMADFTRYFVEHNLAITDNNPVSIMAKNVSAAKKAIIYTDTKEALNLIEGQFILAKKCIEELGS